MQGPGARRGGRSGAARCLALAVPLLLSGASGCAGPDPEPGAWERERPQRVWPLPPQVARVGYLGQLRSAEDLGRKKGWFSRLTDALLGRDPRFLVKPLDVALNRAGLLVVTDPGVPTVHFFDLQRREYGWLDEEVAEQLISPVGVALDDRGNAYVTDSIRHRVFVFDAQRRLTGSFGADRLERPTGIALDPAQQRIYVVDTVACQVLSFDRDGGYLSRFGSRGRGPGQLHGPTYLAVAPDGTLAVSDSLNFRVQTFRPDGTPVASFGRAGDRAGDFARPKGVAVDALGRLYVVDGGFDAVQIFDRQGRLLLAFGAPGIGPGDFNLPVGIFRDATDTIWVADSFNQRLQAFRVLGEVGGTAP